MLGYSVAKRVLALISESMDGKLPLNKRMGIQFHLLIRSVFREREIPDESSYDVLSADARKRIEKQITKKARPSSS